MGVPVIVRLPGRIQGFNLNSDNTISCCVVMLKNDIVNFKNIDVTESVFSQYHVKRPTDKLIRQLIDACQGVEITLIHDLITGETRLPGDFVFS